MSKPILFDALLVRALAAELHERYAGRPVRWIRFERDTRTLRIRLGRNTLVWDLARGSLFESTERAPAAGTQLPREARLASVVARPDDRVMQWRIEARTEEATRRYDLWLELLPNRRDAVLTTEDGRVVGAFERAPGSRYAPPAHRPRPGAEKPLDRDAFRERLRSVAPAERERVLLAETAWISPVNARAVLGAAATDASDAALDAAWQRYRALTDAARTRPVLLAGDPPQPYPVPLEGVAARAFPDLLAAFGAASGADDSAAPDRDAVRAMLTRRLASVGKRLDRMRAELAGARTEAERLRHEADLLIANASRLPRGRTEVALDDWAGNAIRIELDPALEGAAHAERRYEAARRRERAAERLPGLIEAAQQERHRLEETIERLDAGELAPEQAAELLPEPQRPGPTRGPDAPALPYRRYRTSGGLEVRVGKGARANDELTLRYSSPEDIWMHARGVGGAHVVLRWGRRDENPPAADLVEAAVLAALHSRARTSGTVAVDYTRRKYVRKRRGSPVGQVVMERGQTIFVQPDPGVGERLREGV